MHNDAIEVDDGPDRVEASRSPRGDLGIEVCGDLGDERGRHVNTIEFLDHILDVTRRHTLGVQCQNLLVETGQPSLILANQLRLEGAVAIARRIESEFSHFAADGFCGVPIASVGGGSLSPGFRFVLGESRDGLSTEVNVHFGIEHALEGGLHQAAKESVEVFQGLCLAGDIAGELLGLELEGSVHARISVRKGGEGIYPNLVPDTRFLTGPGCLSDLKNRGLNDIFIVCVDGLTGFPEAIRAAYPQAKVQPCIVHLVRAALKYVTQKDSKLVAADLKKIYQSATVHEAEQELEKFAAAWGAKYPTIVKQWRLKWNDIITLFDFPPPIRKAIYTTNAIESVNSVIRKFTRNRKQYPNAESALKLVYLAIHEASKRWTMPIKGWKAALNHFAIVFEDRLPLSSKN